MKKTLCIGIVLVGLSGQAMSMGHPHNMFAARKQLRSKVSVSTAKPKVNTTTSLEWKHAVETAKTTVCERLLAVLTNIRPARSY